MEMAGKKKNKFKSLYLSCRRHFICSNTSHHYNPISKASLLEATRHHESTSLSSTTPPSRESISRGQATAEMYWERARRLELELIQLNKWLDTEKKLTDCLNNKNELVRLADGGYLHNFCVSASGRPSLNLAIQVSALAIVPADTGSTISQVLNRMALMGRDNLIDWLLESMPMHDISGRTIDERCKTSTCSEEGFMEAIFSGAIEKLESLVIDSLQIQMSGKEIVTNKKSWEDERDEERVGESVIQVMLLQVRDPEKGYEAFGDIMIGFAEASIEESGFFIKGVHVAGISAGSDGDGRGNFLWCVSTKSCEGSCSSSGQKYTRNPLPFQA